MKFEIPSPLVGQRQFWRKPSVFATRSVSEGLYLTRSLAYASGYYFEKSGAVQLGSPQQFWIDHLVEKHECFHREMRLKSPHAYRT